MGTVSADVVYFFPYLVLAAGTILTLLVSVIRVDTKRPAQLFALLTLAATIIAAFNASVSESINLWNGAIEFSALGLLILQMLCGIGVIFIVGFSRYMTKEGMHLSDYYHLVLLLIGSAAVLSIAKELMVVFIALEAMSLAAYCLVSFRRSDPRCNEAAIKYFVLGGVFGAIFLMGAAMVYGATGTTQFTKIFQWTQGSDGNALLFNVGHVLMLIALLFKVAAVPFHLWKPDVYEGAPTNVTGLMATVISTASFVVLVRVLHLVDYERVEWGTYQLWLKQVFRLVAVMSLVVGSVVAITQTNLKRLLAYSSISHSGYLLLGLLATLSGTQGLYAIWVYLVAYALMTSGLFVLLGQSVPTRDQGVELIDLTGLLKRSPAQTVLWSVFLFSMAGLPFTAGFIAKYSVLLSVVQSGEVIFAVVGGMCVAVSAYAYVRPIALMVMREADPTAAQWTGSIASNTVAWMVAAAVLAVGTVPHFFLKNLRDIPFFH